MFLKFVCLLLVTRIHAGYCYVRKNQSYPSISSFEFERNGAKNAPQNFAQSCASSLLHLRRKQNMLDCSWDLEGKGIREKETPLRLAPDQQLLTVKNKTSQDKVSKAHTSSRLYGGSYSRMSSAWNRKGVPKVKTAEARGKCGQVLTMCSKRPFSQ